jgi:hypothetical protein
MKTRISQKQKNRSYNKKNVRTIIHGSSRTSRYKLYISIEDHKEMDNQPGEYTGRTQNEENDKLHLSVKR